MSKLHTLVLPSPQDNQVLALGKVGELPAMRRLAIDFADLWGENGAALGQLKMPKLLEIWLRRIALKKRGLQELAATPLFDNLRVLTFESTAIDEAGLEAISQSPCAANLRILRIHYAGFRSLEASALTRPGAFPELTTLVLDHPYADYDKSRKFKKNTAGFLKKLATPKLRYLRLAWIDDYNEKCNKAIASNPALKNLIT